MTLLFSYCHMSLCPPSVLYLSIFWLASMDIDDILTIVNINTQPSPTRWEVLCIWKILDASCQCRMVQKMHTLVFDLTEPFCLLALDTLEEVAVCVCGRKDVWLNSLRRSARRGPLWFGFGKTVGCLCLLCLSQVLCLFVDLHCNSCAPAVLSVSSSLQKPLPHCLCSPTHSWGAYPTLWTFCPFRGLWIAPTLWPSLTCSRWHCRTSQIHTLSISIKIQHLLILLVCFWNLLLKELRLCPVPVQAASWLQYADCSVFTSEWSPWPRLRFSGWGR